MLYSLLGLPRGGFGKDGKVNWQDGGRRERRPLMAQMAQGLTGGGMMIPLIPLGKTRQVHDATSSTTVGYKQRLRGSMRQPFEPLQLTIQEMTSFAKQAEQGTSLAVLCPRWPVSQ